MNCPIENAELSAHTENGIAFHFCGECHGMFFTKDELLGCLKAGQVQVEASEKPTIGYEITQKVIKRACPSCQSATMLDKLLDDIAIDICPECKGVWLDAGELAKILARHRKKHGDGKKGHGDYSATTGADDGAIVVTEAGSAVVEFFGDAASWLGDAGSSVGDFFSLDF